MVAYYLDSSALLKRYLNEVGSVWLRRTLASSADGVQITSHLSIVEGVSAFNRRYREDELTAADHKTLQNLFYHDCRVHYQIVPFDDAIVRLACTLLDQHPLRAYDATHLATALIVHQQFTQAGLSRLIFLCADDRLNTAASAEGLPVDNPNDHP